MKTYLLNILVVLFAGIGNLIAQDKPLPFDAQNILRRMDESVKIARKGEDIIKAKQTAIKALLDLKKSPLMKPDVAAALDARVATLKTEIANDPNLMLGEWRMDMIGYSSTYKFLPGGVVTSGSTKGTWKVIPGEKLEIVWGPVQKEGYPLPLNTGGMNGKDHQWMTKTIAKKK